MDNKWHISFTVKFLHDIYNVQHIHILRHLLNKQQVCMMLDIIFNRLQNKELLNSIVFFYKKNYKTIL